MQINGGVVSYEDGVKTVGGDTFSPTRKVRVELNFSVEDGEDSALAIEQALFQARDRVNEYLGLKRPTAHKEIVAPKMVPSKKPSDKDRLAEEAGLPTAEIVTAPKSGPKKGSKAADALDDLENVVIEDGPAMEPDDDISDLTGAAEVEEVTDEELLSKITHKNGETKNATAIRALVAKFSPGTDRKYQAIEIEQAKRPAFLAALAKVPKA